MKSVDFTINEELNRKAMRGVKFVALTRSHELNRIALGEICCSYKKS